MAITTIAGKNYFLIEQYLDDEITKLSVIYHDLEVRTIDCENMDFATLISELSTQSLFSNFRIFKLKYLSYNRDFIEKIDQLLTINLDQLELFIVDPNLDSRSKIYKTLKEKTNFKLFNELDEYRLIDWVVDRAKTYNAQISKADARYLVERVGSNQLLCDNELNKLSLYKSTIDREAINQLIELNPSSKTFDLINAAFSRNYKLACNLYRDQRRQKVDPSIIIGLLAWQLHVLAVVSQAKGNSPSQMANDMAIAPSVISRTATIAQKINYAQVTVLINRLIYIDNKAKTAEVNLDDALLNWIMTF